MQIKDQLQQTGELEGKLERMADFSFLGDRLQTDEKRVL